MIDIDKCPKCLSEELDIMVTTEEIECRDCGVILNWGEITSVKMSAELGMEVKTTNEELPEEQEV